MHRHVLFLCLAFMASCGRGAQRPSDPPAPTAALVSDPVIEEACRIINATAVPTCYPVEYRLDSRLLDDAIYLYRQGLYEAAVAGLTNVIRGRTGDDGCGIQRAIFYRGKAFYKLGKYRAAFVEFVLFIQAGPDSFYYQATAKWVEALRNKLPASSIDVCLGRYASISEDVSQ